MIRQFVKAILPRNTGKAISIFRRHTFCGDGMMTVHAADFLNESRFLRAYSKGLATGSWCEGEPVWRVYNAIWAGMQAARLEGDFVECGVNRGGMSLAVMDYLDFNTLDKSFYLLDTFSGLPETLKQSAGKQYTHRYSECYDEVVKTFSPYTRAVIIRGEVPDTLSQIRSKAIAYLSIDMNHPSPEIAALCRLWPRIVPGGIVLLDDYAYIDHRPHKEATDRLTSELGVNVLSLPTGQGMIIKI